MTSADANAVARLRRSADSAPYSQTWAVRVRGDERETVVDMSTGEVRLPGGATMSTPPKIIHPTDPESEVSGTSLTQGGA